MLSRKQRLERSAILDVAGAVEELVDVELQPGVFEDPQRPVLIELHQHVDIAVPSGLASCDRTEDRRMGHAQPPQLVFMSAQGVENVVQSADHLSTTSLPNRRQPVSRPSRVLKAFVFEY